MATTEEDKTIAVFEGRCLWCSHAIIEHVKCDVCIKVTCVLCSYLQQDPNPVIPTLQHICLSCVPTKN